MIVNEFDPTFTKYYYAEKRLKNQDEILTKLVFS